MESLKESGMDKDAELKVKTKEINNVRRQVSNSFFSFFLSLFPPAFLSLLNDEIANDLLQMSATGAADCCFVPVRAK